MAYHLTTEDKVKVIEGTAAGKSIREIGREIGKSHGSVNKLRQLPEVKAAIEAARQRIINEGLEKATDNIIYAINAYQAPRKIEVRTKDADGNEIVELIDNPEVDKQLRDHGARFSERVLESAGSLASQNTSIFVQNIYNDQRTAVPPEILEVLKGLNQRGNVGSLVYDAEIEED